MLAGMDVATSGCDGATGQAPPGIAVTGLAVQRDVARHSRIQGAPHLCSHASVSSSSRPVGIKLGFKLRPSYLQSQLYGPAQS